MKGSGPGDALHTFGEPGEPGTDSSCANLHGTLCATTAHVTQEQAMSAGRSGSSETNVEGHGCLPKDCTTGDDLTLLAGFYQKRAREAIPGNNVQIELAIDCSARGGSEVKVGSEAQ